MHAHAGCWLLIVLDGMQSIIAQHGQQQQQQQQQQQAV